MKYNAEKTEKITQPARIAAFLHSIAGQRSLVNVRLAGSERYFNSVLLNVDHERGYLYLDELFPAEGHKRVVPGIKAHIYTQKDKVGVHFLTVIEAIQTHEKTAVYVLPFPEAIDYQQKRSHYRVYIGLGQHFGVKLKNAEEEEFEGRLVDLSLGGLGVSLPRDTPIKQGEALELVELYLPDEDNLNVKVEVRRVQDDSNRRQLSVGLMFLKLSAQADRILQRSMIVLEREQIRRQSRTD